MKPILVAALAIFVSGLVFAAPTTDECPVHHVALQPTKLAIVYGLPSPEEFEESEVAKKRFPFGRNYVLGGCIPVEGKDTVDGFICPECVKARAAWLKKHRD